MVAMDDEVVFLDDDFAIVKSERLFGDGFNCYKANSHGSDGFTKINRENAYFIHFDAAKEFLDEYRKTNDE